MTGRLPFIDVRSAAELLERQLTEPIPAVSTFRDDVSIEVDRVLATATAKEPADRYDSIHTFVEDFVAAVTSGPGSAAEPDDLRSGGRVTTTAIGPAGRHGVSTAPTEPASNPYQGLDPFTEAEAGRFFGREAAIERLLDALGRRSADRPIVAVVGPSGVGKSSLVRAGLIPGIRSGVIPGSDRWFTAAMVPGQEPFDQLASALLSVAVSPMSSVLDRLGEDHRGVAGAVDRLLAELSEEAEAGEASTASDAVEAGAVAPELVLIIDQFEELFTQARPEVARRLLDALVYAIEDPDCRLRLVLTLRADFWDRPLRHAGFARLLDGSTVHLSSLGPDDLERAIVEPASRAGGTIEPGLVPRLVADVADQPMALPLLQFALTELWDRSDEAALTLMAYEQIGGLAGAIATNAEDLYAELGDDDRAIARRVFGALVTPGEGSPDTGRRALRAELGSDQGTGDVVDRFGLARLLSFDRHPQSREPTVELAHEALLQSWPRLQEWIDEDRDRIRSMRHLSASAAAWEEGGQDDGDLYGGARLASVEDQARSDALGALEARFVSASLRAREASERVRRRQVRRLRGALAAVAVVAIIAVVAGSLALVQQSRADREAEAAQASEADAVAAREDATDQAFRSDTLVLASTAERLAGTDPALALQLAVAAVEREESTRTTEALLTALGTEPRFDGIVAQLGLDCQSLRVGTELQAVAETGTPATDGSRAISVRTLSDDGAGPATTFTMPPVTNCATPSPDGTRVLGFTPEGLTTAGPNEGSVVASSIETSVASWSVDGSAIVSVGSIDGRWEVRRHDPDTHEVIDRVPILARTVQGVHVTDELVLVHTDPPTVVDFESETSWPLAQVASLHLTGLSADGRYAAGVSGGHIALFDVESGERLWRARLAGDGGVSSGVSIDPTGGSVAVDTALGIELFEVATGDPLGPVIQVGGIPFLVSPETLYLFDEGHRLARFALGQDTRAEQLVAWPGGGGAISPDGTAAMTPADSGGSGHVGIELATGERRPLPVPGMLPLGDDQYVGIDDSTTEVVFIDRNEERRIDVSRDVPPDMRLLRLPRVSYGQVVLMLADRSAPQLLTNHVLVLDLVSGDVIGSFPAPGAFLADQLGPDELLIGRRNQPAQIVDLAGNVVVDLPAFDGDVSAAAPGPNGDILLGLNHGATVRWSRTEERVIETLVAGHDNVMRLLPVRDGVITQHISGAITRWRWGSIEPQASLATRGDYGGVASLTADGEQVIVPRDDGVYAIPLGVEQLMAHACRLAGSDFDPVAWQAATGLPSPTIAPCDTTES